nr:hypothetical protein [Zoogloeaceae bacterium]
MSEDYPKVMIDLLRIVYRRPRAARGREILAVKSAQAVAAGMDRALVVVRWGL